MQLLDGDEQLRQEMQTLRASPHAVQARKASQTKYQALDAVQARAVDDDAFPTQIANPAGGPPKLPAGQQITQFENADVAQISLGRDRDAIIQSLYPMATRNSNDAWEPVDLQLRRNGNEFRPRNPIVKLRIPRQLGESIQAGPLGLSVTPQTEVSTRQPHTEGQLDGTSVIYANTQLATDTIVKPTVTGFDTQIAIRAADAPESFSYHAHLPVGARLKAGPAGSAEINDDGETIATIAAPSAIDAEGDDVPVSMSERGDTLALTVRHATPNYKYPILVDPEFNVVTEDEPLDAQAPLWQLESSGGGFTPETAPFGVGVRYVGTATEGQWGALTYKTSGDSHIYKVQSGKFLGGLYQTTKWKHLEEVAEPFVELAGTGGREQRSEPHVEEGGGCIPMGCESGKVGEVCVPGCASASGSEHNAASFGLLLVSNDYSGEVTLQFKELYLYIAQPKETHPTIKYNTSAAELDHTVNVLSGSGAWLGPKQGAFEVTDHDVGLGVKAEKFGLAPCAHSCSLTEYASGPTSCEGIQCAPEQHTVFTYESLKKEAQYSEGKIDPFFQSEKGYPGPNGELEFRYSADDAAEHTWSSEYGEGQVTLKVWAEPPHDFQLSGINIKEELSGNEAHPVVEVSSGERGGSLSPGIRSLELFLDGKQLGSTASGCSPGPCTARAEWTINGTSVAPGFHTLAIRATDNAGNTSTETYEIGHRYNSASLPIGPGAVNPETGAFSLEATDVDVSGGSGSLAVARSYNSRNRTAGEEGPLGPQWRLSLGSLASLEVLPEEAGVIASGPSGLTFFAQKPGGGFEPPEGDKNLTLEAKENGTGEVTEYLVKDPSQGTTTRFTLPKGAKTWMPTVSEGAVATDTVTDTYESVEENGKTIVRPTEELAPHGSAECPASEWHHMQPGCRALEFSYDNDQEKTAKGEAENEWGEYIGRLKEVDVIAYNPAQHEVNRTPLARYEYDDAGRLRAEWDPRIVPALKTTYGYSKESLVTAVTPPGQETWGFTYGTATDSTAPGRLLKITRAPASAAVWNGAPVEPVQAPKIGGTPSIGTRLSVSVVPWNNGPVVYGYQWKRCVAGSTCTAIAGATNPNYMPQASETVVAEVTATNGDGSASSESAPVTVEGTVKGAVPGEYRAPEPGTTIEYQVPITGAGAPNQMGAKQVEAWGQREEPAEATAIFPPDEPQGWPASGYTRATIYYRDTHGRTINVATPAGGISTAEYNQTNNVVRSLTPSARGEALKAGGGVSERSAEMSKLLDTENTYNATGTELLESLGPQHAIKLASGAEVEARNIVHYTYDQGAPSNEEYDLVTTVVDAAKYEGKEAEKRTTTTSYAGSGWQLREPTSITVEPDGLDLTHEMIYDAQGQLVETRSPGGSKEYPPTVKSVFSTDTAERGELEAPGDLAVTPKDDVWTIDRAAGKAIEYAKVGKKLREAGGKGAAAGQLSEPRGIALDQNEDVWIADTGNDRIEEFNGKGLYAGKVFGEGELNEPQGITIGAGNNIWVADTGNARIEEFSSEGKLEEEFGEKGTAAGDLEEPTGIALDENGNVWVADRKNRRIAEFTGTGALVKEIGTTGAAPGQFEEPSAVAVDSSGHIWVTDRTRVQEFSASGEYIAEFSERRAKASNAQGGGESEAEEEAANEHEAPIEEEGSLTSKPMQVIEPGGVAVDVKGEVWLTNIAFRGIEEWTPAPQPETTGKKEAHDMRTEFYTAGTEAESASCRNHPEWVGLECQVAPAVEPDVKNAPNLPVTTTTYNMWDEPEDVVEEFGTTTRTKIVQYDAAGRKISTKVLAEVTHPAHEHEQVDEALPKTTYAYNEKLGTLHTQSTTSEGRPPETTIAEYNTLGQLVEYTDAAGNTTTYSYNVDGRPHEVNFGAVDGGDAYQVYTYSGTTGELATLFDSTAGTFAATYDEEGRMTMETYPNGVLARYSYDDVGDATGLEYQKTTECTEVKERCVWYKQSVTPSIHGEAVAEQTSLADISATYNEAGWLTEVQETLPEGACRKLKRAYTYEEEGERTSYATDPPESSGKCGKKEVIATHSYDTGDALVDTGVEYEGLGNITKLPAADAAGAEGSEASPLETSFYADSQVATQTQGGVTTHYGYDPEGRVLETEGTAGATVYHYGSAGGTPTWTTRGGDQWTRNIRGIDGVLDAIQSAGKSPTIELHDLEGDVVGTAEDDNEKETQLLTPYRSTEFGVPTTASPPPYSWLGGSGVSTELESGTIVESGAAYVPEIAAPLQTDGIAIPENVATQYTSMIEPWVAESLASGAAEQLLQAQQARKAREAAEMPAGAIPGGCVELLCEAGPSVEGGGSDGGGGASAASVGLCEVKWKLWEEPYKSGQIWGNFGFFCKATVSHFELQYCVFAASQAHPSSGKANGFYCTKHSYANTIGEEVPIIFGCGVGAWYTGWVWGRIYTEGVTDGTYNMDDGGIYSSAQQWVQCLGTDSDLVQNEVETY
jgi:YD repeat-containing protein